MNSQSVVYKHILLSTLFLGFVLVLSACDSEQSEVLPGQALVNVDGEEITILQLNDEIRRAKVQANQIENTKEKLLESLIDRQLMLAEAQRIKLDRTPNVMQALERAKKQIIAQAYLQNIVSEINSISATEISNFYQAHPELFAQRKSYRLAILRFAKKDYNNELKSLIDTSKSVTKVAKWMGDNSIPHRHDEITRNSTEMPQEMSAKLIEKRKGDVFLINENDDSLLVSIDEIEEHPVTVAEAKERIQSHLLNIKRRETAEASIARLRSSAIIEYSHATADNDDQAAPQSATQVLTETNENLPEDILQSESIERGISGLK